MSGIATAIAASAVVGAVVANSSANKSASAARDAANTQASSADKANAQQQSQFDQTRADYAPYRDAGGKALSKLGYLSGDTSQPAYNWQTDPGYEFRQAEGEKAINRAAAARGGFNSGGTLKDLSRFNSNLASQEYGNAWNRLSSMAGIGQTATGQLGQLGQGYSQMYGNNVTGAGNAMAAGQIGAANARSSGYGGAASSIGQGVQNYQFAQLLKGMGNNTGNMPSSNSSNNLTSSAWQSGNSFAPDTSSYSSNYGGGLGSSAWQSMQPSYE